MWHMNDGSGWWMLWGLLMMGGFWIAVVWAVVAMTRRLPEKDEERLSRREQTALEILERRYASGELTDDEFEAMKQRLVQ